jgi:hypothetical protein
MAKTYKGSNSLEWYNKQRAILLNSSHELKKQSDIVAPRINWVNKDEALFYEINEKEGKGVSPYWVDRNDIRVKEARPLIFQKAYKAIPKNKEGSLAGMVMEFEVVELPADRWSSYLDIISSHNNLSSPGRNVRLAVLEKKTQKWVGFIRIGSPTIMMKAA